MKGTILDFSIQSNSGAISGENGERYNFDGADWKGDSPPARGMSVDFSFEGDRATEVYLAVGTVPEEKSRKTTLLLTFFLGSFGVHKFYLGYTIPGIIFLCINTVGFFFTWLFLFIPNFAVAVIVLSEFFIYLSKSEEEFQRIYVDGRRPMF